MTTVQVDQTCARPRKKKDDSDDDDDDDDASGYQLVDYVHDDSEEEDLEIWSVTGTTEFKGHDKHHVGVSPSSDINADEFRSGLYLVVVSNQLLNHITSHYALRMVNA